MQSQKCLTIFNWAIEQGFIELNPFKGVPVGSQVNKEREHFVTRSDYAKLLAELEKQFDQAEPGGSPFVITKWRDTEKNMRMHFQRIIFRAGLQQWQRVFHNLRGSRSNELFSDYPAHVASQWMGQSAKVAQQHYLHATDADIMRAIQPREKAVPDDTTGIMAWN